MRVHHVTKCGLRIRQPPRKPSSSGRVVMRDCGIRSIHFVYLRGDGRLGGIIVCVCGMRFASAYGLLLQFPMFVRGGVRVARTLPGCILRPNAFCVCAARVHRTDNTRSGVPRCWVRLWRPYARVSAFSHAGRGAL